jgi:hypothetical protein
MKGTCKTALLQHVARQLKTEPEKPEETESEKLKRELQYTT